MQSFLSEMTVNKNIVAVLDINTLQDYPEKQARAREIMRLRLVNPKHEVAEAAGFDGEEEMFKFAESCGLETLCGDHSRCAIFNLSQTYKHLSLFKRTRCKILIADTSKQHDRDMLKIWGNRDNIIAGNQLKPSFADYVLQLRRYLVNADQIGDVNQGEVQQIKLQMKYAWDLPLASVGQIYQIAKVSNPVEWALHEQILRGDVHPMKNRAKATRKRGDITVPTNQATSAAYSVGLGNLSQEDRISVLTRLRNGDIDCTGINLECTRLKAMHLVREEILKLANLIKKGNNKKMTTLPFPSWAHLRKAHERCTTSEFVDPWVNWVLRCKVRSTAPKSGEKKPQLGCQEAFKKAVYDVITEIPETRVVCLMLFFTLHMLQNNINGDMTENSSIENNINGDMSAL